MDNNGEDDVPIVSSLDGVVEENFPPFAPHESADIYQDYFYQCRSATGDYFSEAASTDAKLLGRDQGPHCEGKTTCHTNCGDGAGTCVAGECHDCPCNKWGRWCEIDAPTFVELTPGTGQTSGSYTGSTTTAADVLEWSHPSGEAHISIGFPPGGM